MIDELGTLLRIVHCNEFLFVVKAFRPVRAEPGRGLWDVGCGTWDVGRGRWKVGRGIRDAS